MKNNTVSALLVFLCVVVLVVDVATFGYSDEGNF